ncbi:MAG: AmmeMemoRadiSam system protein A [Lachnospiraceae bacterium]|jgi:AmmeMemoRadiSam system protein A/AmmeMemoRadiSam system protein B
MGIIYAVMVPHPPVAVPEIGGGREKEIQPTLDSYAAVADLVAKVQPETIVLSTPHATMYRDYFEISPGKRAGGSFSRYGHPEVNMSVSYDTEFVDCLCAGCRKAHMATGSDYEREPELDQGTMVPLYFVNKKYTDYKLVRVGLSGQSLVEHYKLGQLIQKTADELGRKVLYIASGDLSHCQLQSGPYGLKPEGPEYDRRIMQTMSSGNFEELLEYDPVFLEKAEECGHRSFCIMAGALDKKSVEIKVLTHEATFGVGYGFVIYKVTGDDPERSFLSRYLEKEAEGEEEIAASSDPYVRLARAEVKAWVTDRKRIPVPSWVTDKMRTTRAGAFVSIHEFGDLRGCIGTISATCNNVAEEIIQNAVSACSRDPRFDPVTPSELPYLSISVDVLGAAERIESAQELDVHRYGVICSNAEGKRGLLLPDLEGVDTVEQQVKIACRKGGISINDPTLTLQRFEVVRHV